jgi:glycosyltransferase involved in cell wall biosynthesis
MERQPMRKKENEILCTVIVPVYNSESTIRRCVSSLREQSEKRIEIILIDDGSEDGSGALCDEMSVKDSRILVIHQSNKGVSAARNAGLDAARGKKIIFADSDDYVGPSYVENLLSAADLSVAGYVLETKISRTEKKYKNTSFDRDNISALKQSFLAGYFNYVWAKSFSSKIIRENDIRFDTDLGLSEDTLFVSTYLLHIRSVQVTDAADYHYIKRWKGTLSTRRFDPELVREIETANDRIYSRLKQILGDQDAEQAVAKRTGILYRNIIFSFVHGEISPSAVRQLYLCRWFRRGLDFTDDLFADEDRKFRFIMKTKSFGLLCSYLVLTGRCRFLTDRKKSIKKTSKEDK